MLVTNADVAKVVITKQYDLNRNSNHRQYRRQPLIECRLYKDCYSYYSKTINGRIAIFGSKNEKYIALQMLVRSEMKNFLSNSVWPEYC
jgi:hypothetical protein